MVECVLCGSKATRKAKVEGSVLDVCDECVKFGKEIPKIEIRKKEMKTTQIEEMEQELVKDFHKIIRKSREKKKLTQDDLAKKLKEKASVIKRIEEGWKPSMKLIKKLERFFEIKLREKLEESVLDKRTGSRNLTIGDIVEVS
ncbi:MAG: multiprotein bridging factor aMBF1 [Candidatus Aenigmatarchaeota archaeon]